MNLIDLNGLKHAPVDIAFNTMCLYAYNALITSGFYEEVLSELPHNKIFTDEYKAHRDLISSISVASGIHYWLLCFSNPWRKEWELKDNLP